MTEYIISRCDGDKRQVLGTVRCGYLSVALMTAYQKWWIKPNQFFDVTLGTRAEIAFARDMEAEGIMSLMEFEEEMKEMLGETEDAR